MDNDENSRSDSDSEFSEEDVAAKRPSNLISKTKKKENKSDDGDADENERKRPLKKRKQTSNSDGEETEDDEKTEDDEETEDDDDDDDEPRETNNANDNDNDNSQALVMVPNDDSKLQVLVDPDDLGLDPGRFLFNGMPPGGPLLNAGDGRALVPMEPGFEDGKRDDREEALVIVDTSSQAFGNDSGDSPEEEDEKTTFRNLLFSNHNTFHRTGLAFLTRFLDIVMVKFSIALRSPSDMKTIDLLPLYHNDEYENRQSYAIRLGTLLEALVGGDKDAVLREMRISEHQGITRELKSLYSTAWQQESEDPGEEFPPHLKILIDFCYSVMNRFGIPRDDVKKLTNGDDRHFNRVFNAFTTVLFARFHLDPPVLTSKLSRTNTIYQMSVREAVAEEKKRTSELLSQIDQLQRAWVEQRDDYEKQIGLFKDRKHELLERIDFLTDQWADCQRQKGDCKTEKKLLEDEVERLREQLATAHNHIDEEEQKHLSEMKQKDEVHAAEIGALRRELDRKNEEYQKLQEEHEVKGMDIAGLQFRVDEMQGLYEGELKRVGSLTADLDNVRHQLQQVQQRDTEMTHAAQDEEKEEMVRLREAVRKLKQELHASQADVNNRDQEISELETEKKSMVAQIEGYNEAKDENVRLENENEGFRGQITNLETQLQENAEEVQRLRDEILELNVSLRELQEKSNQVEIADGKHEEISRLQEQLRALEADMDNLRDENSRLESDARDLVKAKNQLGKEIESLQMENEELNRLLEEQSNQVGVADEKHDHAKVEEFNKLQGENEELKARISLLEERSNQASVADASEVNSKLANKVTRLMGTVAKLKTKVNLLLDYNEILEMDLSDYEKKESKLREVLPADSTISPMVPRRVIVPVPVREDNSDSKHAVARGDDDDDSWSIGSDDDDDDSWSTLSMTGNDDDRSLTTNASGDGFVVDDLHDYGYDGDSSDDTDRNARGYEKGEDGKRIRYTALAKGPIDREALERDAEERFRNRGAVFQSIVEKYQRDAKKKKVGKKRRLDAKKKHKQRREKRDRRIRVIDDNSENESFSSTNSDEKHNENECTWRPVGITVFASITGDDESYNNNIALFDSPADSDFNKRQHAIDALVHRLDWFQSLYEIVAQWHNVDLNDEDSLQNFEDEMERLYGEEQKLVAKDADNVLVDIAADEAERAPAEQKFVEDAEAKECAWRPVGLTALESVKNTLSVQYFDYPTELNEDVRTEVVHALSQTLGYFQRLYDTVSHYYSIDFNSNDTLDSFVEDLKSLHDVKQKYDDLVALTIEREGEVLPTIAEDEAKRAPAEQKDAGDQGDGKEANDNFRSAVLNRKVEGWREIGQRLLPIVNSLDVTEIVDRWCFQNEQTKIELLQMLQERASKQQELIESLADEERKFSELVDQSTDEKKAEVHVQAPFTIDRALETLRKLRGRAEGWRKLGVGMMYQTYGIDPEALDVNALSNEAKEALDAIPFIDNYSDQNEDWKTRLQDTITEDINAYVELKRYCMREFKLGASFDLKKVQELIENLVLAVNESNEQRDSGRTTADQEEKRHYEKECSWRPMAVGLLDALNISDRASMIDIFDSPSEDNKDQRDVDIAICCGQAGRILGNSQQLPPPSHEPIHQVNREGDNSEEEDNDGDDNKHANANGRDVKTSDRESDDMWNEDENLLGPTVDSLAATLGLHNRHDTATFEKELTKLKRALEFTDSTIKNNIKIVQFSTFIVSQVRMQLEWPVKGQVGDMSPAWKDSQMTEINALSAKVKGFNNVEKELRGIDDGKSTVQKVKALVNLRTAVEKFRTKIVHPNGPLMDFKWATVERAVKKSKTNEDKSTEFETKVKAELDMENANNTSVIRAIRTLKHKQNDYQHVESRLNAASVPSDVKGTVMQKVDKLLDAYIGKFGATMTITEIQAMANTLVMATRAHIFGEVARDHAQPPLANDFSVMSDTYFPDLAGLYRVSEDKSHRYFTLSRSGVVARLDDSKKQPAYERRTLDFMLRHKPSFSFLVSVRTWLDLWSQRLVEATEKRGLAALRGEVFGAESIEECCTFFAQHAYTPIVVFRSVEENYSPATLEEAKIDVDPAIEVIVDISLIEPDDDDGKEVHEMNESRPLAPARNSRQYSYCKLYCLSAAEERDATNFFANLLLVSMTVPGIPKILRAACGVLNQQRVLIHITWNELRNHPAFQQLEIAIRAMQYLNDSVFPLAKDYNLTIKLLGETNSSDAG